jgi:hypothetical protein
MNTCPALRPRWCPAHSALSVPGTAAFRPLDGVGFPSPNIVERGYPAVHDYTYFGAQSHGLHPWFPQLRTLITGFARGVHYQSAG